MPSARTTRRALLAATALAGIASPAMARILRGSLPWTANEAYPPQRVVPGPWQFFTADEAAVVEAMADRLIPEDELGPGGKAAGCGTFIDRQLAGPYGSGEWWYMQAPFGQGTPSQGFQGPHAPAAQYRLQLGQFAAECRRRFGSRLFHQLDPAQQDQVLAALEKDELPPGRSFLDLVLTNVQEGYFADPIHGGNKDMCGWKLVGFPGTRYDYREMLDKPNQPYPLPPVAIAGRPEWTAQR